MRGFERVTGSNATIPTRQTKSSAGYDICCTEDINLAPSERGLFRTGIKAYMNSDEYLALHIRSSIGIKKGLMLTNNTGIIDSDYYNNADNEGEIHIPLINLGRDVVHIKAGERIAQGIFCKYLKADNDGTEGVRSGGMGSTGTW